MVRKMIIAGIDEAGRGSLAGGIFAGAVILPLQYPKALLKDSKVLSEKQRETAFDWICQHCDWGAGSVTAQEVDQMGVKKATHLAMKRAIGELSDTPEKLHIDGNDNFLFEIKSQSFIKGDAKFPEISAASIVAKFLRDQKMCSLSKKFPQYCFEKNKGYGSKKHLEILEKEGHCEIHRKTYEPLKTWLVQTKMKF